MIQESANELELYARSLGINFEIKDVGGHKALVFDYQSKLKNILKIY